MPIELHPLYLAMTRFFPPPQLSAIIARIDALPCGVDLMSERDHAVAA